jgi:hypothetical protein
VSVDTIALSGVLPGGPRFAAIVSSAVIVLDTDGRVCAAHPRWMTRAEAAQLAEALHELEEPRMFDR